MTVAVLAGLALSGCGVAGTDFQPGVAAEVGDTTIGMDQVDEAVSDFCAFLSDNPAPEGTPQPRTGYRSDLVRILVEKAALEQILDDLGTDAGPQYRSQVAEIERANRSLPAEQEEAKNLVETSLQFIETGKFAAGIADLQAAGNAEPSVEEAALRGDEVLSEWLLANDVEINPQYGLSVETGTIGFVDDQLSVAVGEAATGSSVTEAPDPAYVAGLPASQTCG